MTEFEGKPFPLPIGRIVAKFTYLSKFAEATPKAIEHGDFDFLVVPLGWVEFLHTYFAGFGPWVKNPLVADPGVGDGYWLRIAANMIASSPAESSQFCVSPGFKDYDLPEMTDQVVAQVPAFSTAKASFAKVDESPFSKQLAYGANEFAICHEVAHIAAKDFSNRNECRADLWGLAAYFGSWPLQRALYTDLAQTQAIRAAVAPFAFIAALRAYLNARTLLTGRIYTEPSRFQRMKEVSSLNSNRLAELRDRNLAIMNDRLSKLNNVDPKENELIQNLFVLLSAYENAFLSRLSQLTSQDCQFAHRVAQTTAR